MSYCRWSECDLYVFGDNMHALVCMSCKFAETIKVPKLLGYDKKRGIIHSDTEFVDQQQDFITYKRSEMIEHIKRHQKSGDKISKRAIERLEKEIKESGDITKKRYM